VQDAPVAFDTRATLARLEERLAEAAEARARLVVFPEAYLGGYPKGADFGARVGLRSDGGRRWFRRYFDGAVALDGPELAQVAERARGLGLNVVLGIIERLGETLYCASVAIAETGEILGVHRKLMPTAMERLVWGFGDGSTLGAVDFPVGRAVSAICWENYMPLLRAALYAEHPLLYCAPTVDDREVWRSTMRHVAVEGRCFVLAACQFARRCDYPDDYECLQGDEPGTVLIAGGSMIVDPFGNVLAGPLQDGPGLLTAEIDPGRRTEGLFDLDVTGHYARPEVLSLRVDRRPRGFVADSPMDGPFGARSAANDGSPGDSGN
jgi:nitrilase